MDWNERNKTLDSGKMKSELQKKRSVITNTPAHRKSGERETETICVEVGGRHLKVKRVRCSGASRGTGSSGDIMTEIRFEKAAYSWAPACEVAAGKEGGLEAGPHPASSGAKMVGYKSTHILNPSVFNDAHVAWYRWYVSRRATLTLKKKRKPIRTTNAKIINLRDTR